ncbi:MAG TPA: nucleoside triphosphate pyrophosphatase [Steroidobacteraceae bacterium]|nr:nucleoside triphosphate pyrophosphatase [Steroidobacteraceae bacterium]
MPEQERESRPVLRLASASPRRRQLLDLIGVPHVVTPADIDETPHPGEAAGDYVMRLAREKAVAVWARHQDLPVLAADTTVAVDDRILGKPESADEARDMLRLLSGRSHFVHTGIALHSARGVEVDISSTDVEFAEITDDMIRAYWDSGEPQGKAGSYAIQGLGAVFVSDIAGSYTGVMGLPLFETAALLRYHGIGVWHGKA